MVADEENGRVPRRLKSVLDMKLGSLLGFPLLIEIREQEELPMSPRATKTRSNEGSTMCGACAIPFEQASEGGGEVAKNAVASEETSGMRSPNESTQLSAQVGIMATRPSRLDLSVLQC
eukprot:CAMPEP_0184683880 /NCGR_PEP_ID=MMETSP0312-20130426/12992_1 /TAXON_ID=31354 /ORGANISM="Compsopogon coeruleus, Strain SAG 36.94" /LENGTH=118 /DNA_ID=CAMNT_0027136575 /DNA_START=245 /DNA_END=604 /DNA_ORIENTATION=+